ncbi:DNA polymerase III subunit beta [Candidatus Falkowbacteria bacterium CG11_big_fil_rev_8_21_14_0_20_39_10]|uniref:Beta sliding clamp n=1 Tax=Candidatus Falkowbacteria bacterium CG11_big_fil_rev_8_21_14_0_20_39_10 TaxID=1974570 RepID=A0A2M6K9S3_9BACT|nr:MAG: DNA polymerase III subunit beta [Candidatus Falkowbacteria bacterium CG11_big_fil_rev_8_21_14_0_20_39_10]
MNLTIDKDVFFESIQTAYKFSADKINTSTVLQGIYILLDKKNMHFYATDLNAFCHITIPLATTKKVDFFTEPKKLMEFLQILPAGDVEVEIRETGIQIVQGKTKGNFQLIDAKDFPYPPKLKEKEQLIKTEFLTEKLSRLLFTASTDEARPVLTGINFVAADGELTLVATDGFRLSVIKEKRAGAFSSMIVPSSFLREVLRESKDHKEIGFTFSEKEQIVRFTIGQKELYSRLIDGEFPPYERVIPDEKSTTVTLNKDELLRNTKIISIFARDHSNIIVYDFSEDGLLLAPKKEANAENTTMQDIEIVGEPVRVAFNFRYMLDFLNNVSSREIVIELLRSDTPTLFKIKGDDSFFHIIMPVRIQE